MNARISITTAVVSSVLLVLCVCAGQAVAQVLSSGNMAAGYQMLNSGGYGGYSGMSYPYSSATAGESYARGRADVIRSAGMYNLATSMAAVNLTQAVRQDTENRQAVVKAYFELRKMNREYREAERYPHGRLARSGSTTQHARAGTTRRLPPSELDSLTGRIAWPTVLRADQHAENREKLEQLFARRAYAGNVSSDEKTELRKTVLAMLDDLKDQRYATPPAEYRSATEFLHGLAYAGQTRVVAMLE